MPPISNLSDGSLNEPIDNVYNVYMKLFFYFGLVCFVPYLILQIQYITRITFDSSAIYYVVLFIIGELIILLTMDIIGMRSSFIDRISRLITSIAALTGAGMTLTLFFLTRNGWKYTAVVLVFTVILMMFGILSWFFVREERGLTEFRQKPLLNTSMWILWGCGLVLLLECFMHGALLIGLTIVFISYPIVIIRWGHPKVVPRIKPRALILPYQRQTLYNYIIDAGKAAIVVFTILIISYNGAIVVFPPEFQTNFYISIRNLAIVGLFAGAAMSIYYRIQNYLYGLLVIFALYGIVIVEYLVINVFHFQHWFLISAINGFTLAGVYYFIEQKIYKSNNVRAMPGSFSVLIIGIITLCFLIQLDPSTMEWLDSAKLVIAIIGITYLLGYLRLTPMSRGKFIDNSVK